ncbi:MAG: hypothetical protein R3Y46_07975 [Opitutales bacterium]
MNELNTINIKATKTPLDNSTNSIIRFKRGDDLSFRVAIFKDENTLAELSSISSLRFEIYDIGNYQSPSPRTFSILLQKIIEAESINTTLSLEDFESGVSQHCTFEISAQESTLEYGEKWLKISAELTNTKRVTLSAGWIEIEENDSTYEELSDSEVLEWTNAAKAAAQSAIESLESTQELLEEVQTYAQSTSGNAENANTYATSAESSALSASESATSANASATASAESASLASGYATSASASATSASASATSASASASTATSALSDAQTYFSQIQQYEASMSEYALDIYGMSETDLSSTNIQLSMEDNSVYTYGTLTSLTIYSVQNTSLESVIFFTSGSTATTLTYPSTVKTIGSVEIQANTNYLISVKNNTMIIGALN